MPASNEIETPPTRYLKIAVDAPLLTPLTYKTDKDFSAGDSVVVPLGKRKATAVILGEGSSSSEFTIKDIDSLDLTRPKILPNYMAWLEWLADYYVHPIGQVFSLTFAPLDNKPARKSKRPPVVAAQAKSQPLELTVEQKICVEKILSQTGFHTHLLHGVTGSGKTEVYLQLLAEVLEKNLRGLVLVPEISLTPQLIQRFAARFGEEQIAVLHSHLTERERTTQWWSIANNEKKILIGARSALFCPVENLGLIIVDEEHEASYKQDEKLRYNARDAAIMLAKFSNVPIVLGSATPSLESWHNTQLKKYELHTMKSRVADRRLPEVTLVDMRTVKTQKRENPTEELPFWLSDELYENLQQTLDKNEQVALFLNRRGIAQTTLCPECGYIYKCPNCAITLTLHGRNHLVCHYCDYAENLKETCPSCKVGEPKPLGLGTEQIENEMRRLFPQARVARADRDEIQSRETLEHVISQMENHEIDILVGTQMIAKGLDFQKLTLVGLVLADVGFNMPDFRATERTFQLLTQVSGRAGRHIESGGKVILQTYNPEYPSIAYAKTVNFIDYASNELQQRQELGYPPFGKLAALKIVAKDQSIGQLATERMAARAEQLKKQNSRYDDIQILGPVEAPLAKLRGKFRYHMLLKTRIPNILSAFSRRLVGDSSWLPAGSKVQVDIDPINLL